MGRLRPAARDLDGLTKGKKVTQWKFLTRVALRSVPFLSPTLQERILMSSWWTWEVCYESLTEVTLAWIVVFEGDGISGRDGKDIQGRSLGSKR